MSDPPDRRIVNPASIILDHRGKRTIVVTKDILINQLRRDGPKIEKSFDALCQKDLEDLSNVLSVSLSLLFAGLMDATHREKEREVACAQLLLNASNSLGAATHMLRSGYCLQPGIIVRSVLEALATVLHLVQEPKDFAAYQRGSLDSPKTIRAAKKAIPIFGELYGHFSENFAHIGHLHRSLNRLSEYTEKHEALAVNLRFLRLATWLLYVTVELLFNNLVEQPRYWRAVPNGYMYDPSEEERQWMKEFLGEDMPG